MCWPHVNPVPSGAVGKDCQRRLLSRPRFVRAVAPRIKNKKSYANVIGSPAQPMACLIFYQTYFIWIKYFRNPEFGALSEKLEPGSSVSIVSGYGLDDRANDVRSPAEDFSSNPCIQTGSGTHSASCIIGNGSPIPGVSAARAWRWPLTPI
jgi:hypothetical protein